VKYFAYLFSNFEKEKTFTYVVRKPKLPDLVVLMCLKQAYGIFISHKIVRKICSDSQ